MSLSLFVLSVAMPATAQQITQTIQLGQQTITIESQITGTGNLEPEQGEPGWFNEDVLRAQGLTDEQIEQLRLAIRQLNEGLQNISDNNDWHLRNDTNVANANAALDLYKSLVTNLPPALVPLFVDNAAFKIPLREQVIIADRPESAAGERDQVVVIVLPSDDPPPVCKQNCGAS